jgi:UrcA family protein
MTKLTTLAAAVIACGFFAGAAQAHDDTGTMRVFVGDLNVHSEQGAKTALRRIRSAANQFCGPSDASLRTYRDSRSCVGQMTGKAVDKLDSPSVTALYQPRIRPIRLAASGTHAR